MQELDDEVDDDTEELHDATSIVEAINTVPVLVADRPLRCSTVCFAPSDGLNLNILAAK